MEIILGFAVLVGRIWFAFGATTAKAIHMAPGVAIAQTTIGTSRIRASVMRLGILKDKRLGSPTPQEGSGVRFIGLLSISAIPISRIWPGCPFGMAPLRLTC